MSESDRTLGIPDFAEAFGADAGEVSRHCGELIRGLNLDYRICSRESREQILLDAIRKCDRGELTVSGAHRKPDWRRGWAEILREFRDSGGNLSTLTPKDVHRDRPMRYHGEYIEADSSTFERDFTVVFRHWLYGAYFRPYGSIYEFGCGTGHNLALMAQLLRGKPLVGVDWVPESQTLLGEISARYGWPLGGRSFDLFEPDHNLKLPPGTVAYTSSALEQLGRGFGPFLDYLMAMRPALCVNVECILEYYDETKLFDYAAIRYHRARNYLDGFLTRLRELERERAIEIVATKRSGFGNLYHEGTMYVIWRIV